MATFSTSVFFLYLVHGLHFQPLKEKKNDKKKKTSESQEEKNSQPAAEASDRGRSSFSNRVFNDLTVFPPRCLHFSGCWSPSQRSLGVGGFKSWVWAGLNLFTLLVYCKANTLGEVTIPTTYTQFRVANELVCMSAGCERRESESNLRTSVHTHSICVAPIRKWWQSSQTLLQQRQNDCWQKKIKKVVWSIQ